MSKAAHRIMARNEIAKPAKNSSRMLPNLILRSNAAIPCASIMVTLDDNRLRRRQVRNSLNLARYLAEAIAAEY
jgi:hypothetical protein